MPVVHHIEGLGEVQVDGTQLYSALKSRLNIRLKKTRLEVIELRRTTPIIGAEVR